MYSAVVTLEFQQSQYTVMENQTAVEVCVMLRGDSDIDITASIDLGNSSTAEPTDFQFVPVSFTFTPTSAKEMCRSVSVTSDDIIEDDEDFLLTLSMDADIPRVVLSVTEAVVTIEDSTHTNITFLNTSITVIEGENTLLCFSVSLERSLTLEIDFNSIGGNLLLSLTSDLINELFS